MSQRPEEDETSEDEYSDARSEISDSEDEVLQAPVRRPTVTKEKDADEEELERLVFGDKAGFREHLFADATVEGAGDSLQDLALGDGPIETETGLEEADDATLFFYDNTTAPPKALAKVSVDGPAPDPEADPDAPAWEDSDDEHLAVSLASVSRLRKLRHSEAEDVISGSEYTRRLRQQYLRMNPLPEWAKESEKRKVKRRRRSSASSASSVSNDDDGDAEDDLEAALPLETFLRSVHAFNLDGSRKRRKLRPEVIDIQRTRDIADSHAGPVGSLSFHPKHPVLLSSSVSSILHLHHIAPTAHPTPNPLLTSIQIKQTPVRRSEFVHPDGSQIILAGRRKWFHSWNLSTGQVRRVHKVQGHRLEQKSMERFRSSPSGQHMAVIATDRKGGGMLNIIDIESMQWVAQARLDSRGGIADFAWWSTGEGITILGRDGQVGEWDLESRRFLGTWRDEGSTGGTVMALGGHRGPTALGEDRWIAIGSTSGILNVYDRTELISSSKSQDVEIKPLPTPTRCFEQLTTPITDLAFTPDGQLLAFASRHKKDALKLAHLPSCTVYRNWPTDQTPLGRITAMAFGSESNILAVGNDVGKIRLWEIRS